MSIDRSGHIDQWRGLSVLAVVAFHANPARFMPDAPISNRFIILLEFCIGRLGPLGVDAFFVISGFLITRLLLNEESQTGSISLKAFYVRRATRILPALLVYVLTVLTMGAAGVTRLGATDGAKAVSFLCNTSLVGCPDQFGQLWTLGIEEQFYLLWPLLLILSGRFRLPLVMMTMIVAAVCSMLPGLVLYDHANNGLSVYCLCSGVLFALSPRFRAVFQATRIPTWILVVPLLLLTPTIREGRWVYGHPVTLLIIPPILVCVVLARDGNVFGPRLSEGLRQIGLVSYSLYLWNWFATWPSSDYLSPAFRALSVLALPFAWVSYLYVERPFIAAGKRWSTAILEKSRGRTLRGWVACRPRPQRYCRTTRQQRGSGGGDARHY